jgi:hypothetical protein
MLRAILIAFTLLTANYAYADSIHSKPEAPEQNKIPVRSLPIDPDKLVSAINGSFYHPDDLTGIQCAVSLDWNSFFSSLKVKVPEARMQALNGLQIHYSAQRNKRPELNFNWVDGRADTAEQLEDGIKQMIGGFYQTYWPLMASTPIRKASEIGRVETQPDGTLKIFESDANNKVDIGLDKNFAPTHWNYDSPAYKGTFDLDFTDSPRPLPGDLRRLTKMHLVANTGASSMNVQIDLDYQPVNGTYIPHHVTYDIIGAYSIELEFIGCTINKSSDSTTTPSQ